MRLLGVETQPAINDDGGECSVKNSLIHTGQTQSCVLNFVFSLNKTGEKKITQ